jgi:hypothetical protein
MALENITELLRAWSGGDHAAYESLVPLVEAELHRLARSYMARERRDHTLQGHGARERGVPAVGGDRRY